MTRRLIIDGLWQYTCPSSGHGLYLRPFGLIQSARPTRAKRVLHSHATPSSRHRQTAERSTRLEGDPQALQDAGNVRVRRHSTLPKAVEPLFRPTEHAPQPAHGNAVDMPTPRSIHTSSSEVAPGLVHRFAAAQHGALPSVVEPSGNSRVGLGLQAPSRNESPLWDDPTLQEDSKDIPSLYNRLRTFAAAGKVDGVTPIINKLVKRRREIPNLRLYEALILVNVSRQEGSAAAVGAVLQEMEAEGISPDSTIYHDALKVSIRRRRQTQKAHATFRFLQSIPMAFFVVKYSRRCANGGSVLQPVDGTMS